LIQKNVIINNPEASLIYAAHYGLNYVVNYILEQSPDMNIDATYENQYTALDYAQQNDCDKVKNLLIDKGAKSEKSLGTNQDSSVQQQIKSNYGDAGQSNLRIETKG
jgi:ankyrin repeat protein